MAAITFWNNALDNLSKMLRDINFATHHLVDIFIITFLIYVVIRFLQETHSISIIIGIFILIILYGFSLVFDLALTSFIFRYFTGGILIVLAIIFQRELRRFFSLVGFFGFAKKFRPLTDEVLEMVVNSVFKLARKKSGAIIVFPGRESINRYLEGGHKLNGSVSESLILSIFDKNSPGHDGAMVIENNRIFKFAIHLPLSEQIERFKNLGLRHRAGVGLSERSDTLVIIVSEERGIVSLAQGGNLIQIQDEKELRRRLINFYKEKFPKRKISDILSWATKNIIVLAISFILASVAFVMFNSKFAIVQRNYVVPIEFKNVPSTFIVNQVIPQESFLTLQGRSSDFETLQPQNLRIRVDIGSINEVGWRLMAIGQKNVEIPLGLTTVKIEPASIRIQLTEKPPPEKTK